MTNTCPVVMCDKPAGDGIICRSCLTKLEKVLAETRWLMNELDVMIAKESRYSSGGDKVTMKGGAKPLVINLQASDVRSDMAAKLALWTADVSRSRSHAALASVRPTIAGAWLLAHLEDVRVFAAAGDLVEELFGAYAACLYVIDRPAERRYLGECGSELEGWLCTEQLFGREADTTTVCKTCGAEWDTQARSAQIREQALTGMDDRIMTATQAAETMVAYGITTETNATRLRDRIRKWAEQPSNPDKRPLLTKRLDLPTPGQRKRPGYRLGDIIEVNNRMEARRSA